MARRWLLTLLTGMAISVGLGGTASAQELGDPVILDAEVASVTVSADVAEQHLEAEVVTDVELAEAETDVAPTVTAEAAPDGPGLDTGGTVEVAGTDVPLAEATAPADDVLDPPPASEPAPTADQGAAGDDIRPAPQPAAAGPVPVAGPAPVAGPDTVAHSDTRSADSAAGRSGLRADSAVATFEVAEEPSPLVAPPEDADEPALVAAAVPPAPELPLPFIDPTPTVPGVLRLLAGLMVLGAAATWRTVRDELA